MNSQKTRVALLMDKSASYERGLIRGIIKYSNLHSPWDFFFEAPIYVSSDERKRVFKKLVSWRPDFIVMNDSFATTEFKALKVPIFVLPNEEKIPGAINIIADDDLIGEMGAQYFIDKGFANLAFYGTDQIFWSRIRKKAFKKAAIRADRNFFEFEALIKNNWQNNPQRIFEWINKLPVPIAIMACSDEFGIQLIEAANIASKKIPEEIAILGVDNDIFICDLYNPPMSSIDQESETVGFLVAQYINQFKNEGNFEPQDIKGRNFRIITRRSTDVYAIEDVEIKKALSFIDKNAENKKITVNDVVEATCLSRRILEIRFRKLLNRSVLDEIKRMKFLIICQKLTKTDISINEIAYSMGFDSVTTFSTYFKKEKKLTPLEFRKQFKSVK
jgi:LacI family transcriptional regulator